VLPALYPLLDIDQFREFRDQCLEVHFDLSGWFKLAATNDQNGLSSALLDRFDVVQVHPPTKEQRFVIVQKMASKSGFDFQDRHIKALNEQTESFGKLAASVRQAKINSARRCDREIIDIDI
jgi:ATP-dependent Lon protease